MAAKYTQGSLASKISAYPKTVMVVAVALLFLAWPRNEDNGSSSTSSTTTTTKQDKAAAKAHAKCPTTGTLYGIMMDAGSTGSRTHVFEFMFHEDGRKELVREVFEQLKPGLSAYPDDPEKAAQSLVPLMDVAVKEVPKEYQACTPVALKATAGLRLIGEEKSQAILAAVEKLLRSYPFFVPKDPAVVMDGKDEGPYAWITVNFLLGTLDGKSQTSAIFDMGGGSTQVVFVPDSPSALKGAPKDAIYNVKLHGNKFSMYTHSYLGLGLKEAGKSIKKKKEDDKFPCFESESDKVSEGLDFDKCMPFAQSLLHKDQTCDYSRCSMRGVFQPKLLGGFSGDLYVFSYFYDRMEPFLAEDGKSTVGEFKKIGSKICSNDGDDYSKHNKGSMCMDFVYLYTLLHDGYELTDETPVLIKKKIKGIETAWALGAMLVAME